VTLLLAECSSFLPPI